MTPVLMAGGEMARLLLYGLDDKYAPLIRRRC
jgi:hypothetical protein